MKQMRQDKEKAFTDIIRCPQCDAVQEAIIRWEAGMPYPAYVHECEWCGYWIMESEWERVEAHP